MIRKKALSKVMGMTVLTAVLAVGNIFSIAASPAEQGPGIPRETKTADRNEAEQALVNGLEGAAEADAYVLVTGDGATSSKVTVDFYIKKENGSWNREFSARGLWGRGGATEDKREGDGKTPLGTYSFTRAFGIKEDPGSRISYHKLTFGDYWVDDSSSRYYNQMVNTAEVKKTWNSAEHLIAVDPYYDYCLALNYNEARVPGKGSAIFLHCMKDERDIGTSGCVKIPEEYMKTLVQTVTEKTRITIR